MDAEIFAFIVVMTMIFVGTWVTMKSLRVREEEGRLRLGGGNAQHRIEALASENQQLKDQVTYLEDRIAVLERIATDPVERTAREIEQLRMSERQDG